MRQYIIAHSIVVFLFGFAVIFISYVGLPIDFNADLIHTNVPGAQGMSYVDFLKLAANPLTPAWFYPESDVEHGPNDRMKFLRPLQFLLMKFFFERFHYELAPFHMVGAVGSGLLSVIFFLILYHFTRSFLVGWLPVFLYASFASNFFMMVSTFALDFQFHISCLSIGALLFFWMMTYSKAQNSLTFWVMLIGWMICVWLAIKLKSSEKILPFVCFTFLIWRLPFVKKRIGILRITVLSLALAGSLVLVVPFKTLSQGTLQLQTYSREAQLKPVTEKDKQTFSFHWSNLVQRTFHVEGGEFPFTTIRRKEIPQSFSENYGFFLAWIFWVTFLWAPWSIWKTNRKVFTMEGVSFEALKHGYWLTFLWFVITLAGFASGLNVRDTRLLNFAYVPSVLLFYLGLKVVQEKYFSQRRILFWLIIAFFTLYTAWSNFSIFGRLLRDGGGMQDALIRVEKDLYRTVYREEPLGLSLYEQHHELETRFEVIDWYGIDRNWNESEEAFQEVMDEIKEKLEQENTVYLFRRKVIPPEFIERMNQAGYNILLWRRYELLDAKPFAFRFLKWIEEIKNSMRKKKKEHVVLVYQVQTR